MLPINKIILQDCPKKFTADQDKALSPEETLKYFYRQAAAMDLELIAEAKRIDQGRLGIPVFFSVCGADAKELLGTNKQMGKGASPAQAEASACMELAERFSFFSFRQHPANFVTGDYRKMLEAGYPVLPLEYLLKSVHDQDTPPETAAELLADIPLRWTWATNLTLAREVLVPFSWFYAVNEFNGASAGNTLEEAALQGICEVVERHVCARISREKIAAPKIDPATVTDPVALDLLGKFKAHNIELYLHDFSLDTGICTVGAVAVDRSTFPQQSEIVYTAGTTPDPQKALIRTITEVAQLAGDFNTGSNYEASGLPKPKSMAELAYITEAAETISIKDMNNLASGNIKTEVTNCLKAIKNLGLEVLAINTTHPQLAIPALYTIVPGLQFRERPIGSSFGLFAARLAAEKIKDPLRLETKLEQMERLLPSSYFIDFYRGRNLYNMGMAKESLPYFDRALAGGPEKHDLPSIYSYQGHALQAAGEYDQAIAALNKAEEYDSQRPDLYNMLGVCYFKKQQYERAVTCFERAVALNPASAMDYANLGVNHQRLGHHQEAAHFFTLALSLDPSIDFAREQLKIIEQEQN
ncbi:MAG: hypothetical protein CSB24_06285 [Deltaproteobacteria bacterium]|nr:MAG: hypothetical protein CSB24_06285 [Deltaproteobacteria bacterium]